MRRLGTPETPDRTRQTEPAATFRVPRVARAVVRLIRLVPALVATAFAGWAVAAALAGNGTIAAAATLMSLLAVSVAVRATMSASGHPPFSPPHRRLNRPWRTAGR